VNKATVHLQKTLVRLNATTQEDGQDDIAFNDVKDPSSDVYANLSLELPRHDIPYSVRKRIIELDCLKKRCEEENSMVNVEMKRLVSFYETQITLISSHLDQLNSRTASPYSSGLINLLLTLKTHHTQHLLFLKDAWKEFLDVHVGDLCPSFLELAVPSIMSPSNVMEEEEYVCDSDLSDEEEVEVNED